MPTATLRKYASCPLPELCPPAPGTLVTFVATLTTDRKDRDADILEPAGATVDPMMPLLWAHEPRSVIGRLLGVVEHTDRRITGRFAIADTPLGRDAATLLELGAVRGSIGFEPQDFTELRGGRLHIRKYTIVEFSLVGVPSNVDAVVHAYERHKFATASVKSWAGGLRAGHDLNGRIADFILDALSAPGVPSAVLLDRLVRTVKQLHNRRRELEQSLNDLLAGR